MKLSKLLLLFFIAKGTLLGLDISFQETQLLHETDFVFEGKPSVIDWDGDGVLDILFGERVPGGSEATQAYVTYWKNSGSVNSPEFSKTASLQADGEDLCVGVG